MPKSWIELKEARGKKVKRMTMEFDPDYNCVEVEFTMHRDERGRAPSSQCQTSVSARRLWRQEDTAQLSAEDQCGREILREGYVRARRNPFSYGLVARLWAKGKTIAEIAEQIGRVDWNREDGL
jgi:hypothetical protein